MSEDDNTNNTKNVGVEIQQSSDTNVSNDNANKNSPSISREDLSEQNDTVKSTPIIETQPLSLDEPEKTPPDETEKSKQDDKDSINTGKPEEPEELSEEALSKLSYDEQLMKAGIVQLVDENGNFTDKLPTYLDKTGLIDKKLNYCILAVFGPQSSGKSTLLNRLFNTKFPIMNSEAGRYQVTKGVVASKAKQSDILVLDLEGTDSKERGDENMGFERKISLFALSMAEVLIVNMWMQDIGRYNASNYALLKVVFELNLQLFQKNKDHINEVSPLEVLKKQIFEDIDKIWKTLIKPEEFENSIVTDFFDISFTSLPHKILCTTKFEEACLALRERFTNANDGSYVFKNEYKKSVPIDGFQHYASNVWSTIVQNKDLDIPTQKEMVALYRCDEISKDFFHEFEESLNSWQQSVKKKEIIPEFGKIAKQTIDRIVEQFKQATSLYVSSVSKAKTAELELKMKEMCKTIFDSSLQLAKSNAMNSFNKKLEEKCNSNKNPILLNFNEVIQTLKAESCAMFDQIIETLIVLPEKWESNHIRDELETEIKQKIHQIKNTQISRFTELETAGAVEDLMEQIIPIFNNPPDDMWNQLRNVIKTIEYYEEDNVKHNLEGFKISEKEIERIHKVILDEVKRSLKEKFKETAKLVSYKMYKKFEELFKYNNAIIRTFRNEEEIRIHFKSARNAGLRYLDMFFLYRLDNAKYDDIHLVISNEGNSFKYPRIIPTSVSSIPIERKRASVMIPDTKSMFENENMHEVNAEDVIISQSDCLNLFENFNTKIDGNLYEVLRNFAMQKTANNIPWWVVLVVLVLGYNEFMYVLTNPLLLLLSIFAVSFFGWGWIQTNLENFLETGNPSVTIPLRMALENLPIKILNVPATNANSTLTTTQNPPSNITTLPSETNVIKSPQRKVEISTETPERTPSGSTKTTPIDQNSDDVVFPTTSSSAAAADTKTTTTTTTTVLENSQLTQRKATRPIESQANSE